MKLKFLLGALLCQLPLLLSAQNALTYTTNHGAITITGYVGSSFDVTNVVIPATINGYPVTSIGYNAFFFCSSLTNVVIPDSVTSIGSGAFACCSGLTNVVIGNSVTSLGNYAFSSCSRLTNITVAALNPAYSSIDGVLFNKAQTALIQFPGGRGGSYTLPDSVTSIGRYAFAGYSSLTNVVISDSVTSIGDSAFNSCSNLTNVTFLGNAPTLGGDVFYNVPGTVYYYHGTSGWGATYGGLPTVMLSAPAPQISAATAGLPAGNFGFTVTDSINHFFVIEASADLVNWQPISTNIVSRPATGFTFTDLDGSNYPRRFYRVGGQINPPPP